MSVGQNIRARRKEIGMKAETLAKKLGLSPSTIYRYENGDIEKVDSAMMIPFAEALATTPAHLMGWDVNPSVTEKLGALEDQLTAPKRSKQWRVISEGMSTFEAENNPAFQALYQYLTTAYPSYFAERNDDDANDPES